MRREITGERKAFRMTIFLLEMRRIISGVSKMGIFRLLVIKCLA